MNKVVYAWRCGCSKTTAAIEYANNQLSKPNNKIIYATPTIQMEREVKRKLNGLVINSKSKTDKSIKSKIMRSNGESGWSLIEKRNELLKTEKCLIVTHARLINTDPSDFFDAKFITGSRDIIIDEFSMKLRKFYIQRATLLAYIVHPHYAMPKYVTYENDFDIDHKRRENYWQLWEDDMDENPYKRIHKIRVSKRLLKKELEEMFPLWISDFISDCKKYKLWAKTFEYYEKLSLTFRRTYAMKSDKMSNPRDYSRWLWLTPRELKENGIDISDIIGSTYSMLDDSNYRWEGQLYSKLKKVYQVFNYQKTISYIMLQIARQLAKDQYFDTDINDGHPGYYVGGVNPLERWYLQHMFNVTCLDGSATIFKDIYKHYGFKLIDDEEKSITHYADNLQCKMFNFKSFSQTSISNMTSLDLKRILMKYISPFENWAKCWYVIVPSKCTDQIVKALKSLYGKDKVCNCTTKFRSYIDDEGIDRQVSIMKSLQDNPNAKFIVVNHEGQIGSNEFYRRCDGVIAISQLNLPKGTNKIYSEYYGIENYSDLYSAHEIYQESARAKNRLMKPINYKEGHKIPFIALLGMNENQYRVWNRLNTDTKIFDQNENVNAKRLLL